MSQSELARVLDVTNKGWISQIETGAVKMPIKMALRIQAWSKGALRAVDLLSDEDAKLLTDALDAASRSATEAA